MSVLCSALQCYFWKTGFWWHSWQFSRIADSSMTAIRWGVGKYMFVINIAGFTCWNCVFSYNNRWQQPGLSLPLLHSFPSGIWRCMWGVGIRQSWIYIDIQVQMMKLKSHIVWHRNMIDILRWYITVTKQNQTKCLGIHCYQYHSCSRLHACVWHDIVFNQQYWKTVGWEVDWHASASIAR